MLVAALSLTMFACGKKEEPKTIGEKAAKELYKQLCQELEFDDELHELDDFGVGFQYSLPDGAKAIASKSSSGSTAEQVAMFTAKDDAQVKELEEMLKAESDELFDTFTDYNNDELPKIAHSVVKTNGKYVFFVVCKDYEAAEEMIDAAFKKATEAK